MKIKYGADVPMKIKYGADVLVKAGEEIKAPCVLRAGTTRVY